MVLSKIPSATENSWRTRASSHTQAGAAFCSSQHIYSSQGLESPTHPCRSWYCRSPHLPLRAPPNKPTHPEAALHKVECMEAFLGEEKGLLSHAPQQRLWKSSSHLSLLCLLWPSTALPPPLHFPRASPPPHTPCRNKHFPIFSDRKLLTLASIPGKSGPQAARLHCVTCFERGSYAVLFMYANEFSTTCELTSLGSWIFKQYFIEWSNLPLAIRLAGGRVRTQT